MATKIIIIGQEQTEPKKLKPIEFFKILRQDARVTETNYSPNEFRNIELISLGYSESFDLMFAYTDKRESGVLVLGKFNDGVVE